MDRAVNSDVFETFVEQVRVPELGPSDVVILDDLSSPKRIRTGETLWAAKQSVLDQVSPDDAANGYKHCGYTLRLD